MQRFVPLAVFGLAVFLGALLLFTVEPLAARMLLPRLGGSPAVWSGCMAFFQVALLAGYLLAHLLARHLRPLLQVAAVGALLLASLATLPVGPAASALPPAQGTPLPWLLGQLSIGVGAAFVTLATLGSLLQRWFSLTPHPHARDPYFLYALSNAGSLAGLLLYPLVLEPFLPVGTVEGAGPGQAGLWSWAYVAVVPLVAGCAVLLLRSGGASAGPDERPASPVPPATRAPWRWVAYAFLPSSAMLGATRYMATDLVSFPLLWVVPLALYLLSFVLVFARRRAISTRAAGALLALATLAVAASMWAFVRPPIWLLPLHPLAVLAVGLTCHGRLADERPAAEALTGFYLWIGVGGALGGAFNTFVAPLLFDGIFEYPLVLVLACLLRPGPAFAGGVLRRRVLDVALPLGIALVAWLVFEALSAGGSDNRALVATLAVGIPSLLAGLLIRRPARFALGVTVVFLGGLLPGIDPGETLLRKRTFYGVHRVVRRDSAPFRTRLSEGRERTFVVPHRILYHGTTRHGVQIQDPQLRRVATSYYHRSGPIGRVFETFGGSGGLERVGVIGLGSGTLAAYGAPGRRFAFYELDPEVARIARDPALFTFIADSDSEVTVEVGDGRRSLSRASDASFDLLVLDAFGSDAVPVHLLTREAFELYLDKLAPGGLLALHLTNQYLDLAPVIEALTHELGLAGLLMSTEVETGEELLEAKDRSIWAVLARGAARLEPLDADGAAVVLPLELAGASRGRYLWTDDYSNVLAVLRW